MPLSLLAKSRWCCAAPLATKVPNSPSERSVDHAAKIGNLGNFGNSLAVRTYERPYFDFPEFASLARGCSENVSDVSGNGEHPMDFGWSGGGPMLNNVRHAPEPDHQLPPPSLPSPRVRVRRTEAGHAVEPVLDETVDLDEFCIRFVGAFGTTEQVIADALFHQVVNALHPDPKKALDATTTNLVLAFLHRIG